MEMLGCEVGEAEGREVGYTEGRAVGLRVLCVTPRIIGADDVGTLVLGFELGCDEG